MKLIPLATALFMGAASLGALSNAASADYAVPRVSEDGNVAFTQNQESRQAGKANIATVTCPSRGRDKILVAIDQQTSAEAASHANILGAANHLATSEGRTSHLTAGMAIYIQPSGELVAPISLADQLDAATKRVNTGDLAETLKGAPVDENLVNKLDQSARAFCL